MKSIFASKTAVVNFIILLAGAAAFFWPSAAKLIQEHAASVLSGIGVANIGLRFITHGRVSLFGSDS